MQDTDDRRPAANARQDDTPRTGYARLAGALTVNLTRIYTRLGDAGQTHLGDMSRVSKLEPRVEAYGTVDELNATIGLALLSPALSDRSSQWLRRIQNDLFDVGADIAVPPSADERGESSESGAGASAEGTDVEASGAASRHKAPRSRLRITPQYVAWLEQACDEVNEALPPLRSFVIPGGSEAAARIHIARTVCRRAERRALAVPDLNQEVIRYLNRLSDLLFILARAANELSDQTRGDDGEESADRGESGAARALRGADENRTGRADHSGRGGEEHAPPDADRPTTSLWQPGAHEGRDLPRQEG